VGDSPPRAEGNTKRPLEISPPEACVPRLTTTSLSSRWPVKGSGRTVWRGRGHRPWLGRQQAEKRRQGMPPINKGTNASKVLATQPHQPLKSVAAAVGIVYELPKKWGCSLSTPAFDASPLHRRSIRMMKWGSATGRRHHDKTRGVVSNPRERQGYLAATGRSAYLGSLVPTATTALLQPEAWKKQATPQPSWSSHYLRCLPARLLQSLQRFSAGPTDEEHVPSVGIGAPLRKHRGLVAFCGSDLPSPGESIGRFIGTSQQHPSCQWELTLWTAAALCRHGVELLPVLQNLSIDVHQNIICFLNKFFPTPLICSPSSRIHQSDVLLFKRHLLCAVNQWWQG